MQLSHLHTSPYISIDYASILIPMTLLTTPQDRHPSTSPIIDTLGSDGSAYEQGRKTKAKNSWRGENLAMPKHPAIWKLVKVGSGGILPDIGPHRFPTDTINSSRWE